MSFGGGAFYPSSIGHYPITQSSTCVIGPIEVVFTEGHPFSMYLQDNNPQVMTAIQHRLQQLYQVPLLPPEYSFQDLPREGDLCCALWPADNTFYRARVQHVEPLIVRFVDYGNTDFVQTIYKLDYSMMETPPHQARHCKLKGLANLEDDLCWSNEQRKEWEKILRAGSLIAIFHYNPNFQNPNDPPFEVEIFARINVTDYVMKNNLLEQKDLEQDLPALPQLLAPTAEVVNETGNNFVSNVCEEFQDEEIPLEEMIRSKEKASNWLLHGMVARPQDPVSEDQLPPQIDYRLRVGKKGTTDLNTTRKASLLSDLNAIDNINKNNGDTLSTDQHAERDNRYPDEKQPARFDEEKRYNTSEQIRDRFDEDRQDRVDEDKHDYLPDESIEREPAEGCDEFLAADLEYTKLKLNEDDFYNFVLTNSSEVSPNLFYILPISDDLRILDEMSQMLNDHFSSKPLPSEEWPLVVKSLQKGTLLAIHIDKQGWLRAQLVECDIDSAKVFMIDIAETADVEFSYIRRLPSEFCKFPKMAIPCTLNLFPPKGQNEFPKEASETMVKILKDDPNYLLCNDERSYPLKVVIPISKGSEMEHLGQLLVEKGWAEFEDKNDKWDEFCQSERENWDPMTEDFISDRNRPGYRSDNVEMVNEGYQFKDTSKKTCKFFSANGKCPRGQNCKFLHQRNEDVFREVKAYYCPKNSLEYPKVGAYVYVQITSFRHPGCFFCILPFGCTDLSTVDNFKELRKRLDNDELGDLGQLSSDMTQYYKHVQFFNFEMPPEQGEMIAARDDQDGRWYRAKIIDSNENSIGNEYWINYVDYGFLKMAVECQLHGIQPRGAEWSEEALNFCDTLIVGSNLVLAKVIALDEFTPMALELFFSEKSDTLNIGEVLIERGEAVRSDSNIELPISADDLIVFPG